MNWYTMNWFGYYSDSWRVAVFFWRMEPTACIMSVCTAWACTVCANLENIYKMYLFFRRVKLEFADQCKTKKMPIFLSM